MSHSAQVRSTASIEAFRAALLKFQQRVEDALAELDGQMRRAVDWVETDRPAYWRQESFDADDRIQEAKRALDRCLMFRVGDERPACQEERDALEEAKAHREYCREKVERVRHWNRTLKHELVEFQGRLGQLQRLLEYDIPRASGVLQKIQRQIEFYNLERPPEAMEMPESYARTDTPEPATGEATEAPSAEVSTPAEESDIPRAKESETAED